MREGIFDLPVTILGYVTNKVHVELNVLGIHKLSFLIERSSPERRILSADLDNIVAECEAQIRANCPTFIGWFRFRRNQFVRNTTNFALNHAA